MELRDYQQKAVDCIYAFLRERAGNPCAVVPTAGGKTPIIATLCRDAVTVWNGRVLILAHVKELLQQSAEKLQAICPTVPVGIYSAGLKRRETDAPVIVAGIQSAHDKASQLGRFDLVIVDESHLIPESGDGMYRRLIADLQEINPDLRVIGLTATPYRLSSGAICQPDGILNEVCYEVSVKVLMNRGFLCKLVSKAARNHADTSVLRVVRGEFDTAQTELAFQSVIAAATEEVIEKTAGNTRRSVLIFCQNVAHAKQVAIIIRQFRQELEGAAQVELRATEGIFGEIRDDLTASIAADYLEDNGRPVESIRYSLCDAMGVGEIYGDTPAEDRAGILADFKSGKLKYLVNVNVLTTGFDAPNIDCVVLLRATVSPGLYYQMVGRGFRIHEDKTDCLVLDFGENVKRHGPVDCIKPKVKKGDAPGGKECPECHSVMAIGLHVCLDCGYEWPPSDSERVANTHGSKSSDDEIVSGEVKAESREVMAVTYKIHSKKGADETAPKTLRVTYQVGMSEWLSEWVCIEHPTGGFAHRKAEAWWGSRTHIPLPDTVAEACAIAAQGWLAPTEKVTVKTAPGKDFPELTHHVLGDKPTGVPSCPKCGEACRQVIVPHDEPRLPGKIVCSSCSHLYRFANHAEIQAFGILDPSKEQWEGEIVYDLAPEDLPPKPTAWDDYETPENPF